MGTLAAGIAHEINNILTPALAYAHMAKNHPDDVKLQTKAIDKSISCIESATTIAQQILDFTAATSDSGTANVRSCIEAAMRCAFCEGATQSMESERMLSTGSNTSPDQSDGDNVGPRYGQAKSKPN